MRDEGVGRRDEGGDTQKTPHRLFLPASFPYTERRQYISDTFVPLFVYEERDKKEKSQVRAGRGGWKFSLLAGCASLHPPYRLFLCHPRENGDPFIKADTFGY